MKTSAPRVYQLVRRNPKTGEFAMLLENFGAAEASVEVVTAGKPTVLKTIRASVVPEESSLNIRIPAHAWLAVSFQVR